MEAIVRGKIRGKKKTGIGKYLEEIGERTKGKRKE